MFSQPLPPPQESALKALGTEGLFLFSSSLGLVALLTHRGPLASHSLTGRPLATSFGHPSSGYLASGHLGAGHPTFGHSTFATPALATIALLSYYNLGLINFACMLVG